MSLPLSLCLKPAQSFLCAEVSSAQDLLVQSSLHFTFDTISAIQSRKEHVVM